MWLSRVWRGSVGWGVAQKGAAWLRRVWHGSVRYGVIISHFSWGGNILPIKNDNIQFIINDHTLYSENDTFSPIKNDNICPILVHEKR